jgi:nucleoside-diphosphate-sugar epimerase
VPIKDLVEMIVAIVGFDGEIRWDASKPDGQPRRRVDAGRAKERLGFEPHTSFEEGLRETVDWYRGHREEAERRQR